ncbi:MAG: flagellar hook-associated protein FlgL [Quinella sp. 1Q5]|nr:flagellar hook-associated protein FlgL [Quinella sp. 1Q5]
MHFMYNYQNSLNKAYQQQGKLFEQADGSSLHRASDNPMNYSKLLRYNVSENENTQYRENIKTASSWMKNSDDVMIHMTEMMQTLKEKSVQAANSDKAEDDFAAIHKEMFAHMQEIVSVSNTQLGDRYLFAGQKDLTKPFEMSLETYDRGQPKNLDVSQSAFFKGTDSDYNTELFQMLTVTDDAGNSYYLDTENFNLYTQDFMTSGYKEVIAHGYTTIDAAKASTDTDVKALLNKGIAGTADKFQVADAFTNQGLLQKQSDVPDSVSNMFTYDDQNPPRVKGIKIDGTEYTFKTVKQNIVTYNGDNNLISMVKLNGATDPNADTVNSTGATMFGRDIFDNANSGNEASGTAMLNELFCVCAKVNDADLHWMSSDGVTVADVAHSTMLVQETKIGARQQLYNQVETMLDRQADNITEDITNVSGADIAQLATKLMQQTALYNLSLSLGGRILPQSLADYL